MSRKDRNNMTKQIYNTRGMTLEEIKEVLRVKVGIPPVLRRRIVRLQESLDCVLSLKDEYEQEISYLEKFIARKEKR